jgi:hypothetical protein
VSTHGRSTLSAGIPSIEIHLGQTAVGPVATVLQTVRGRITTGRTARKERTDQATVVINIASVLAAPIPGMIQIGQSSTIVAAIFQISLWAHCRSPSNDGSNGRQKGPVRRRHMSRYLC